MTTEDNTKLVRQALRERLNSFNPSELNPELVRLKMVEKLLDDHNRALSEINEKERKAIAQALAIASAYKYYDATGVERGGLPLTEAFCREYLSLGSCLDRKREDAVVACLRPRSGYNYKFGPEDGAEEKPGLIQRLIGLVTGKKQEEAKR
jgi:hypothetical protein